MESLRFPRPRRDARSIAAGAALATALAATQAPAAAAAIRVVPLGPVPGARIADRRAPIEFELRTRGDAALRRSDVELTVDGRDRSAALQIVGTLLEYLPAEPLGPGTHRVEVRVRGALPTAWTFTVADDAVPTRPDDAGGAADAAAGLAPIAPYAEPYGVGGYGQPYNYGAYGVPVVPSEYPASFGGFPAYGGGYPAYGGGYGASGYGAPGAYGYATGSGYGTTLGGGFGTYVAPSPFGTFYTVGSGPFGPGAIVRFVFVGVPGGTGYVSAPGLIGTAPLVPFAPGYFYALGRMARSGRRGSESTPVAHFEAAGLAPFAVPSRSRVRLGAAAAISSAAAAAAAGWRPRLARDAAQFASAIRPPRVAVTEARSFAPLVYRGTFAAPAPRGAGRAAFAGAPLPIGPQLRPPRTVPLGSAPTGAMPARAAPFPDQRGYAMPGPAAPRAPATSGDAQARMPGRMQRLEGAPRPAFGAAAGPRPGSGDGAMREAPNGRR